MFWCALHSSCYLLLLILLGAGQVTEDDIERLISDIWGTGVKTEVVMKLLGLAHCKDTLVGDALLRGRCCCVAAGTVHVCRTESVLRQLAFHATNHAARTQRSTSTVGRP